jgi:hypothetical protein
MSEIKWRRLIGQGYALHKDDADALVWADEEITSLRAKLEKANYKGPGSPIHSLTFLISELHKRFPDAHNPILSDPPEPKYLAAIDSLLAENKRLREKTIEVSSQNLIIDGLPLDKWIYDAICRNRGGLGTLLK